VPHTKNETTWNAWGDTHSGKQRSNNEDRIYCDSKRGIFIVADGMGGEAAGEIAAEKAIDFIQKRLRQETGTVARRIREAITAANNEIYRLAERKPDWRGMACVLTLAVIEDGLMHVGHVGDSRLYKIRGGEIRKATPDHSPIGKREDSGELTELEAMRHPRRNEVYRDIGSQPHKPEDDDFVEYLQVPFEPDAAALICSDGLSDMLTSSEILAAVENNAGNPHGTVRELIERANAAGGKDNISAIVIEADGFAAARPGGGPTGAQPPKRQPRPRSPAMLSRWAFLAYGLIAGAVLLALLWPPFETAAPPVEPAQPPPQVLVVDRSSAEFPTIGKALEKARAGDRIEVAAGEYEEAIRLKDGVDVIARVPGRVVLQITRPLPGVESAITAEGIAGATVSGLVIRATPAAGLPLGVRISDSNVTLTNVEVSGAVQAGIWIEGSSGGALAGNYIYSNAGPGIVVAGAATPSVTGNTIERNGLSRERPAPGAYILDEANPLVIRNVFSGNGAEAIRVRRRELREKMMNNLFVGSARAQKPVGVEQARP